MTMRLLMIHTGGTLLMQPRADGAALSADAIKQDLLGELPVLKQIAEIDSLVLFRLDSADMQPEDWVEIAGVVHDKLEDYDGFVIIHGTDTMAYTASALAFLLPGLDRSVVLTGAQRPLGEIRSDGRANLVDACQVATMRIPEVAVAFNSRLFRGCRVTKLDAWGMNAFGSPSCPPLAELGLGVQVGAHVLAPRPKAPFDPRLEARVLAVRVFPGLDPKLLQGALTAGVRGMVVEAFGAGNVPRLERSLIPAIEAGALARRAGRHRQPVPARRGRSRRLRRRSRSPRRRRHRRPRHDRGGRAHEADDHARSSRWGGAWPLRGRRSQRDWAGELTREAGGRARAV
jgi:L-asparaginase